VLFQIITRFGPDAMNTDSDIYMTAFDSSSTELAAPIKHTAFHVTVIGLIRLIRPDNVFLIGLAVLAGAITGSGPLTEWPALCLAAFAVSLIASGGYVLNDILDIGSDRINKPDRPLVTGIVTIPAAALWALLLLVAGIAISTILPITCLFLSLFLVSMALLYDFWGKGQPLIGNLMTATMVGLAFPMGSLAAGLGWWGLVPGALALLLHIPLEIVKDLQDMPGDRECGLRTWPLVAGDSIARRSAQMALILILIVLPIPAFYGWLGLGYLVVAIPGVGIPIIVLIRRLSQQQDSAGYYAQVRMIKRCVVAGLLALLLG
jgi:4-hydroxybenzoate polyprenyltransferase